MSYEEAGGLYFKNYPDRFLIYLLLEFHKEYLKVLLFPFYISACLQHTIAVSVPRLTREIQGVRQTALVSNAFSLKA